MSNRIERQVQMIENECRRLAKLPPSTLAISDDESVELSIRRAFSKSMGSEAAPLTVHLVGVAQDQYDRVAQLNAGMILDGIIAHHHDQPKVAKEFAELRELILTHGWQPRTERLFRRALTDPRIQPKNGAVLLSSRRAQTLSDKATHDVGMLTIEAWKQGCFGFVDTPPILGWGARASTNRLSIANVGVRFEVSKYFREYKDVEKPGMRKAHLEAWSLLLAALDGKDMPEPQLALSTRALLRSREMCKVLLRGPPPSGSEIRLVQKRALLAACMVEGTAFGLQPTQFDRMAKHLQSLTLGGVDDVYNEKPFVEELKRFVARQPQFVPPFSLLAEAVHFVKRTQQLLDRAEVSFTTAPGQSNFATLESDALRGLAEHLRATLDYMHSHQRNYRSLPPSTFFDREKLSPEDLNDVAERCGWLADLHIRDSALANQYRAEAASVAQMAFSRHKETAEARSRAERILWMFHPAHVDKGAAELVNGSPMQLPKGILGDKKINATLVDLRLAHIAARWRTVEVRRRMEQASSNTQEESSVSKLLALAAEQCKLIRKDFQRIYDNTSDHGVESLALMSTAMAWLWTLQSLSPLDAKAWQVDKNKTVKDILETMELALMLASWLQVRQWLPNVRLPETIEKAQVFLSYKRVPNGDSLADQFSKFLVGENGDAHTSIKVLMDTSQEVQHDLEWLKRLFIEQFSVDATVCFVNGQYADSPWCAMEARIAGLRVNMDAGKYALYILRTGSLDFTASDGQVHIWNMPAPLDRLSAFAEIDGTWQEPTMVKLRHQLEKHSTFARAHRAEAVKPPTKRKADRA